MPPFAAEELIVRMPVPKGAEILRATEGERREGERRAAGVEDRDEAWKLEEIIFGICNAQTVSCQAGWAGKAGEEL